MTDDNTMPTIPEASTPGPITTVPEGSSHSEAEKPSAPEASKASSIDAAEEAALQIDERQLTRQALWERKLLDFSLRNNLLNTRLGKRAVQFISFEVNKMEDLLQTGENYTVQPWPEGRKKFETTDGIFHSAAQAAELKPQFDEESTQAVDISQRYRAEARTHKPLSRCPHGTRGERCQLSFHSHRHAQMVCNREERPAALRAYSPFTG